MKSDDGWESNHGIVTFKSDDLIHWYDECAVDFHSFDSTADADKIWAPQAMYDDKAKKYMVYFSCHNKNSEKPLPYGIHTPPILRLFLSRLSCFHQGADLML